MELTVVASGSKGNAYILTSGKEHLLLECGVKFKDIKKALDFNLGGVCGCLVSHEHLDHSKSMADLLGAGIDVYTTLETATTMGQEKHHNTYIIACVQQYEVGGFLVKPFPTIHDAVGAVGFLIQEKSTGERLLFMTDTVLVNYRFNGLNYIMIECNHCLDIISTKLSAQATRIMNTHLSLESAKEFLSNNDLSNVRQIVLLHLSDGNSDAERMVREIKSMTNCEVVVATTDLRLLLHSCPF